MGGAACGPRGGPRVTTDPIVPIVFVRYAGPVDVDDYYGSTFADPIDVAALDSIRPGIVEWVRTANASDAIEVRITPDERDAFYAVKVDDRFRQQIADERVAASNRTRETWEVMYRFEKDEWRRRACDLDAAVAYLAGGWRVADVPCRPADEATAPHATIVVRSLSAGIDPGPPILYPAGVTISGRPCGP